MKDRDGIEYLPESSESEKDSSKDGSADKSDNEKQYQWWRLIQTKFHAFK